jgi:soluble lytic murein transglycosylase-like protein
VRLIPVLIVAGLIPSGVLAQTAQPPNDPVRPAITKALLPAIPAAVSTLPADPLPPANSDAGVPPSLSTSPQKPNDPQRAAREKQQASIARQRESARKQAESVGAWIVPGREAEVALPPDPPDLAKPESPPSAAAQASSKASCDPLGEESLGSIIDGAAKAHSVHPKLLHAVIEQESRFHPCAVSPKGAKGLMQLMPDTAAELGVNDPFDPKENIEAGARYLRQLLDKYKGDLPQALGAYNAGPGAVDQAGGIPNFRETRDYVQSIIQKVGTIPLDLPSIPMPKPIEN